MLLDLVNEWSIYNEIYDDKTKSFDIKDNYTNEYIKIFKINRKVKHIITLNL